MASFASLRMTKGVGRDIAARRHATTAPHHVYPLMVRIYPLMVRIPASL